MHLCTSPIQVLYASIYVFIFLFAESFGFVLLLGGHFMLQISKDMTNVISYILARHLRLTHFCGIWQASLKSCRNFTDRRQVSLKLGVN